MNKREFLAELGRELAKVPQDDRDRAERLRFYSEMIDDRIEEGLPEEQAIEELGSIQDIVAQIRSENSAAASPPPTVQSAKTWKAWEIVLLVLGSPLWIVLLAAAFVILLSVYAVLWSTLVALWAMDVSLAACSVGGVLSAAVVIAQGNAVSGVALLGAGLICAGLAILGFLGCRYATAGIWMLTKRIFVWVQSLFVKRRNRNE